MIHKILPTVLFLIILVAGMALAATVSALVTDQYTTGLWKEYVKVEVDDAKKLGFENGFYVSGYEWCMFELAGKGAYPWIYQNTQAQEQCLKLQQELFLLDGHKLDPPPGWDMSIVKYGGRTS